MADEKKTPETTAQEDQPVDNEITEKSVKMTINEKTSSTDKVPAPLTTGPVVLGPQLTVPTTRVSSMPIFTKVPPNDLYRKLLPAVLFLLTFVTVMTMLLIYMDTVALGAQQFRLNMSRDYELASIPQDSESLVAFVREFHLAPRQPPAPQPLPDKTPSVEALDGVLGEDFNGTFVEILPSGARDPGTARLEARGWAGLAVRAAPRDYLALRGPARALHACLSPTDHPREVAYHEPAESRAAAAFSSRVLCLPLYTVLLAARAAAADYTLLGGSAALPALKTLPFHHTRLTVIEVRSADASVRNATTAFMTTKNYTLLAAFDDSVMFRLNTTREAQV